MPCNVKSRVSEGNGQGEKCRGKAHLAQRLAVGGGILLGEEVLDLLDILLA